MSEKVTNPFVYTHKTSAGLKARLTGGKVLHSGGVYITAAVLSGSGEEHLFSCKEDASNPNHFIGSATAPTLSPINPWENVAVDTPVLVTTGEGRVYRRYFAGVSSGGWVETFDNGATSWSAGSCPKKSRWLPHQVTLADGTQPAL